MTSRTSRAIRPALTAIGWALWMTSAACPGCTGSRSSPITASNPPGPTAVQKKAVSPPRTALAQPEPPPTRAPQPAAAAAPLRRVLELCGPGELALHRAAARLLETPLSDLPLDAETVTFAVRTSGGPYVQARALRVSQPGRASAEREAALESSVQGWLAGQTVDKPRRCGVAAREDPRSHSRHVALVLARSAADLEALPSHVARGARLSFRARLLEPATNAELVVLGPDGSLRQVASEFAGDQLQAAFFLDAPGTHVVQLMIDREGGPEPVLEAWVGVDEPLPDQPLAEPAPGEDAAHHDAPDEQRLTTMINVARRASGVAPLARSAALDELARAHAAAMQRAGRLAHDLGAGNPIWRVESANVFSKTTGENLAHAPSLERAHRSIWASPSHRANLLATHFDSVGIGLARDAAGNFWVCELLVDQR